jgi:hypothetical protein
MAPTLNKAHGFVGVRRQQQLHRGRDFGVEAPGAAVFRGAARGEALPELKKPSVGHEPQVNAGAEHAGAGRGDLCGAGADDPQLLEHLADADVVKQQEAAGFVLRGRCRGETGAGVANLGREEDCGW